MLVVDTSALLAILLGEPERFRFKRLLLDNEPKISAGTLIETLRVVHLALGAKALSGVDVMLETSDADAGNILSELACHQINVHTPAAQHQGVYAFRILYIRVIHHWLP